MAQQLPPPPNTASGSSNQRPRKRARRMEASSSGDSALGPFDISNVKYSVMTPPRPRPLVSIPGSDTERLIRNLFGSEFRSRAIQFASENGIQPSELDVDLTTRYFRDDPEDSQAAIYIVVDSWTPESPHSWEKVVELLKVYIDDRIKATPAARDADISVEMVYRDLARKKYISHVDASPQLATAWPRIKKGIFDILQLFEPTKDRLTTIAVFKLGFDPYYDNPKTVYVAVDYESPEHAWPSVVDRMQTFLDGFKMDLQLHMEHNIITHFTKPPFDIIPVDLSDAELRKRAEQFDLVKTQPYSRTVNLGADIGAAKWFSRKEDGKQTAPLVGTLGCWLQVKINGVWKIVALTNYHVVRPVVEGFQVGLKQTTDENGKLVVPGRMLAPEKGSRLRRADSDGIKPRHHDQHNFAQLEHPTRQKHCYTVSAAKDEIKTLPAKERAAAEEQLKQSISIFDNDQQLFGKVFLASGFLQRTASNGRLDWALIEPTNTSRIGRNELPDRDEWARYVPANLRPHHSTWKGQLGAQVQKLGDHLKDPNFQIYKVGTSTRGTIGTVDVLKHNAVIKEETYMTRGEANPKESTEIMCLGHDVGGGDYPFAMRGDSGAVVWDKSGNVIGLLFTGLQPQGATRGYTYVTPIEDIFESILKMSEGGITEVRLASN